MLHHVNHGGAFRVQYTLSPATKGGRGGLKVAAATLVDLKLEAQVGDVHLGPISLLPPKNALRQPPQQTQESLTPTPAATLTLQPCVLGGEGGGEAAHLRLSHP